MTFADLHPSALELNRAQQDGRSSAITHHLQLCVECRVRDMRLARVRARLAGQEPSESAVARILDGTARLPHAVTSGSLLGRRGAPKVGELWRVGREEPLLVLVRRVFDDAVEVMPVTLDTDLADEMTLLLSAEISPLGMELAVLTAIRGHVHPGAFLSRVTEALSGVGEQVAEVLASAREDRSPIGVVVGARVNDADDQKVEYQQALADMLADFGPASWPRDDSRQDSQEVIRDSGLLESLTRDLPMRHPCRISPGQNTVSVLPDGNVMRTLARIAFADTGVALAVLPDWQAQSDTDLARGCRGILDQEPGAHAVAVCDSAPDYLTIVVAAADTREALESPGGSWTPPRSPGEPLPVIDALAKHLDTCVPAWEDPDEGLPLASTDLVEVARLAAEASVLDLAEQGRRATTAAKKQAWTAMPEGTSERLSGVVGRIVAGESTSRLLDALLDERRP